MDFSTLDFNSLRRKAIESAVRLASDERLRGFVGRAADAGARAFADVKQVAATVLAQAEAASAEVVDDTRELKDRLDKLRRDRTTPQP